MSVSLISLPTPRIVRVLSRGDGHQRDVHYAKKEVSTQRRTIWESLIFFPPGHRRKETSNFQPSRVTSSNRDRGTLVEARSELSFHYLPWCLLATAVCHLIGGDNNPISSSWVVSLSENATSLIHYRPTKYVGSKRTTNIQSGLEFESPNFWNHNRAYRRSIVF